MDWRWMWLIPWFPLMSSHTVFSVTLQACKMFLYTSHSSIYCWDPMLSSDFASVKSPGNLKTEKTLWDISFSMQWPCRLQYSDVIPHCLLHKYVITSQKLCYFHTQDGNITQHGLQLSHCLTLSSTSTPPLHPPLTVFNHFYFADGDR